MSGRSKRVRAFRDQVDKDMVKPIDDALDLVKELATAKFPESVDVSVNLGVDPRKSDQVVRGSTVLPNGTGKSVRVAVFAQGKAADAATEAGADIVGMDDLAEQVKKGELNFDMVVAAPDAMRVVGGLGKILGPRGLMPNPKVGTVTPDVGEAVRKAKAGHSSAISRRPSRARPRVFICARSPSRPPWDPASPWTRRAWEFDVSTLGCLPEGRWLSKTAGA